MNFSYPLLSILVCILLSLGSCKTSQITPEKYEKNKVYFGNGGGFTGGLREFCMLDNGDVYQINPSTREAILTSSKGKAVAKRVFKQMESMKLKEYQYDKPGNMYCWVKYHTKTDSAYLIWGDETMEVSAEIESMYTELVEMTRIDNK